VFGGDREEGVRDRARLGDHQVMAGVDVPQAPVAFGAHRKPEAILLPYEAYERYEALVRQHERLDWALSAAQSVQVELPGPFSPERDQEVGAYVDGEISAAELYKRTVARYRRA
jgi:hypothetical protein